MDHDTPLITTIAAAFGFAPILGFVAEQNRAQVKQLRSEGMASVAGDACDAAVLIEAHITNAAMLVIATPDPVSVRPMVATARALNPAIEIVLRTHSEDDSRLLRREGIGTVFYGEDALAKGMTGHVLERFTPHPTAQ